MRRIIFPQEASVPSIWNRYSDAKRRSCMLMVTHTCNLNCSYCYETHKDNQMMTLAMAQEIIKKEFEQFKNNSIYEDILIDFMGGEPLMNFPLIRDIVEWLEKDYPNFPWLCYATTNATLIYEARKKWFRNHKDSIVLGGSYDGTAAIQITNRGEEASKADLEFLHSCWPYQGFRMTISKETLPQLASAIIEMQRKGYTLEAALAQGVDWNQDDARLYLEQLRILKNSYLSDESLFPINIMTKPLAFIGNSTNSLTQTKFCGTGTNMVTYDVDGSAYGCHMFTPIVLGKEKALKVNQIDWSCKTIAEDPVCGKCVLKCWCPTCMGFNYRYRGDVAKRDLRWCKMILAEALVVCEFQIEYLTSNHTIWGEKDGQYAQQALEAYSVLSHLNIEDFDAPFLCKSCPQGERR